MKILSKNLAGGDKLYAIFSLLFFISNTILTISQTIQQDEVGTLFNLQSDSISSILETYRLGYDTQVPLYFLIVYPFVKILYFFGSDILVLRLFSLGTSLLGLYFLYKIFGLLKIKTFFPLFLLFLSTVNYFFSYYIATARPYALFFCLYAISFYLFLELNIHFRVRYAILFMISLIGMIYTHYYGIIYVSIFIVPTLLNREIKNIDKLKISFIIIFSILTFLPWLQAVQNQLKNHNMIVYHEAPSAYDFLFIYFTYYRYLAILVLPVIFIGSLAYYVKGISKNQNPTIILFLLIFLLPLLNYLFTRIGFRVYADRYFIPSFMFTIVYFLYTLNLFKNVFHKIPSWLIVLLFCLLFFHRFSINYKYQQQNWDKINLLTELAKQEPLLCESAQIFFPLYYYSGLSSNANTYFVLDFESVNNDKKKKSSLFDYYGCMQIRDYYKIPNIIDSYNIDKLNRSYWIFDEENKTTFPGLFLKSGFIIDKRLSKEIYHVSKP
jgi:hypothetical protein